MKKDMNLLPDEFIVEEQKSWIKYSIIVFCLVYGIYCGSMVGYNSYLKYKMNKLQKQYTEIESINKDIDEYTKSTGDTQLKIEYLSATTFDYGKFMRQINEYKPNNVVIISMETLDMMANDKVNAKNEEDSASNNDETGESADSNVQESSSGDSSLESDKSSDSTSNENDEENNEDTNENSEDTNENNKGNKEIFSKDITDKNIIMRGYSSSSNDIANYCYIVNMMDCVKEAKISALEEKRNNDNEIIKLFEMSIELNK